MTWVHDSCAGVDRCSWPSRHMSTWTPCPWNRLTNTIHQRLIKGPFCIVITGEVLITPELCQCYVYYVTIKQSITFRPTKRMIIKMKDLSNNYKDINNMVKTTHCSLIWTIVTLFMYTYKLFSSKIEIIVTLFQELDRRFLHFHPTRKPTNRCIKHSRLNC